MTKIDLPVKPIVFGLMLGTVLALPLAWGWHIATDPGFHPWPAVTRCRPCGRRIFAWERYGRRAYGVRLGNPDGLAVRASMTGLVHDDCEGTPVVEMSVKRGGSTDGD